MSAAGRRFERRAAQRLQRAAYAARLIDHRLASGDAPEDVARVVGADVPHLEALCRKAGRPDVARRLGGAG